MPTFNPPVADTTPPILPLGAPGQSRLAYKLFRHYKPRACGRTVLKINGTYATYDEPLDTQVAAATEVYLGGHVYPVTQAVADALTAAGYGAGITA